jgi:protein TonB
MDQGFSDLAGPKIRRERAFLHLYTYEIVRKKKKMKTARVLILCTLVSITNDRLLAQRPVVPSQPCETEVQELIHVVEQMPYFPGCEERGGLVERKACGDSLLQNFIYNNLVYPPEAREQKIEGTVVVSFVIGEEGSVRDVRLVRDIGGGCGEEAVRIVNLMVERQIRWVNRGSRTGPEAVQFHLPVRFRLER